MSLRFSLKIWLLLSIIISLIWLNTTLDTEIIPHTSYIIELGNKQIPVPKRTWMVVGNASEDKLLSNNTATIASKILFGIDNDIVTSFIQVHANVTSTANGWGISSDCKDSKHPFTAIFEHKDRNYKCSFVTNNFIAPETTLWTQSKAYSHKHKWFMPQNWLVVGIRIADHLDIIDVKYGFDLSALIHTNLASNLLEQEQLHATAIQALVEWQKAALYWAERGFRRQLEFETPLPMPTLAKEISASSMIAANRLYQLEALRQAGWLSATAFAAQQTLIKQSVVTQADLTVDIWRLGALKTAGHTTQSLFWMWGVNYLFLGNAYVAGGLALAKSAISPIRYYLQETAWNTWGPRRNPSLPVVDFM